MNCRYQRSNSNLCVNCNSAPSTTPIHLRVPPWIQGGCGSPSGNVWVVVLQSGYNYGDINHGQTGKIWWYDWQTIGFYWDTMNSLVKKVSKAFLKQDHSLLHIRYLLRKSKLAMDFPHLYHIFLWNFGDFPAKHIWLPSRAIQRSNCSPNDYPQ